MWLLINAPAAWAGLVDRIDEAQKGVRTLSAEFVQKNRVKLFKQELVSRGRLYYARGQEASKGSQLRWEYLSPDPSALILADNKAVLVMPGRAPQRFDLDRDATMQAIFRELELWLGKGSLRAAMQEYDMTEHDDRVLLIPKAGTPLSRTFARIEMTVDRKTLLLSRLLLAEKGGDEKEIAFVSMKRNADLPKEAFKMP